MIGEDGNEGEPQVSAETFDHSDHTRSFQVVGCSILRIVNGTMANNNVGGGDRPVLVFVFQGGTKTSTLASTVHVKKREQSRTVS